MDMQFIPIVVMGFVVSLSLTPVARHLALRFGVVAVPNKRNIHAVRMPLMGGLAICAAIVITLLLFSPPLYLQQMTTVLAGAVFIAGLGLLDDRYNLGIRTRMLASAIAGLLVTTSGIMFTFTGQWWIDAPLTIFWITAVTNAVNFQDNMDGLAAGSSAITALFFLLIALNQGLILVSLLAAAILGSALGFLIYNFAPSSMFMGDMGALTLGFLLAITAVKLNMVQGTPDPRWLVPVLALWLPVFDINLVVFTRISEGRSPGEGGRDHTSHRLMALGFNHRTVLFILYSSCTLFGAAALALSASPQWPLAILLAALVAMLYWTCAKIRVNYQLKAN